MNSIRLPDSFIFPENYIALDVDVSSNIFGSVLQRIHLNEAYELCVNIVKYEFLQRYSNGFLHTIRTWDERTLLDVQLYDERPFTLMWYPALDAVESTHRYKPYKYINPLSSNFNKEDYTILYSAYIKLVKEWDKNKENKNVN